MLEIILVKGVCALKIEITQFLNGFRLKNACSNCNITQQTLRVNVMQHYLDGL